MCKSKYMKQYFLCKDVVHLLIWYKICNYLVPMRLLNCFIRDDYECIPVTCHLNATTLTVSYPKDNNHQ